MKKILALAVISIFSFLPAYAEIGLNIGVSGNTAVFHASMTENENGEKTTDDATGIASYASIFIEKTLGDRIAIGLDYVPDALESEKTEDVKTDKTTSATAAAVTQTVQLDFENLTTFYVAINVTENLYLKGGVVQADVITNESLATGSTYANTELDGTMFGVGYNHSMDNGVFFRVEGTYMDLGTAEVTSTNTENKVSIDDMRGASGKLSIGKSF